MVNLVDYIDPNGNWIINLIKTPNGEVLKTSSKWRSDEWYLEQTVFKTGGKVYEFGGGAFSNIQILKEKFKYDEITQIKDFDGTIDWFSFLDADLAVELLSKLDFHKTKIKYACIAFKPVREVDFKINKENLVKLMENNFHFIKQNRTEFLFKNKDCK